LAAAASVVWEIAPLGEAVEEPLPALVVSPMCRGCVVDVAELSLFS
jgi:hypothetical protein